MPNRFLRLPEVKLRVGVSRSSLYLRIAQGTFVKPIRLGPNSVACREEDIDRWMAERVPVEQSTSEGGVEVNPKPETDDAAIAGRPLGRPAKRGLAVERERVPALASGGGGRR